MSGKQIQHLYNRTEGGFVVYDHTEVIDIAHADYKTEIVHLIIKSPPTVKEVPKISLEGISNTFSGVLPDWIKMY
ncbi:MAG: hypothetical protein KAI81_04305 [Candidatus Marinimicrobia bacterium]|nr:hypothetical protein [Candidatus Neomarinimicrobiota bacterium]